MRILFVTIGFSLAAIAAAAQEYRGTILGRVLDQQDAVVPGATLVITNEKTNVSAEAVTEADGAYTVPFLIPGTYRIEVELPGFKKFARTGVTVAIGQRVAVDIRLEVGTVAEMIVVTADASLLDTASGTLGQVIDQTRVEAMPLNGRMIFMLNRLAGGVIWQVPTFGATGTSGLRPFDNNGGSAWSINGGRVGQNEFLLDGAPNSTRGRYNFAPPVDAVEEFKIQTNTYDAQYGRTGGGVVNMTLKSGTNAFRVQGWEFFKHDALNANDTLNKAQGTPKPGYLANQYGVTGGGPVVRNKTFYMATFEGLRERPSFPITTSVPTQAERRGDFSQSYTDQRTPLVIYDPLTTTCAAGRCTRTPFPSNVIPPDRINPIAQKILLLYPLPNVPNQRLNNFVNGVNNARYDYDSEVLRIDHKLSTSQKLAVSIHRNHRDEFRSTNGLQGTIANQGQWPQTRDNRGGTVDWVDVLGSGLLNVRVGFTSFIETNQLGDVKEFDAGQLGFAALPGPYMPRVELEQFSTIGVGSDGRNVEDNTLSLQANYTMNVSRQTLRFGGEYRNIRANPSTTGTSNGTFNFTRTFTRRDPNSADAASGNSVASFLLGYPASASIGAGNQRSAAWDYVVAFFQDDLRLSRRLTVNLGIRWEYESGVTEKQNRLVRGFAFDAANPLASAIRGRSGIAECPACADLRGGLLFAGVDGVSEELFDPDRNNVQPRIGFAYAWNDKTVVRGGYGLYYRYRDRLGAQDPFFVSTPYIANDINGRVGIPETTLNSFVNPFPGGKLAAPGASEGLLTLVGRGISFDDPSNKVPNIHQYNITVSRELARHLMVEASYVGSRSHSLSIGGSLNINAITREDQARGAAYLQQAVPNPFAGLLPGTARNGTTIQRQELLRAFPQFAGITRNAWSIGETWYHSLQTIVQKRMSDGLTFTSSYTFSNTKERNSFLNDQDAVAAFHDPDTANLVEQVTDYHRPHVWVFSGVYELPFGSGKRFGSSATALIEKLIGGWQANWNFNWQSGRPVDQPGGLERISGMSAKLDNPTPDRWFNTCYVDLAGNTQRCQAGESPVWRQRPPFTQRTTPNRFDDIQRPWKPTLDASIFKHVRFSDRKRLEFRLEAFNVTNVVIFDTPNTDFSSANFGRIPQPRRSIYFPRNVQLGVKVYF
ncbi:MAG: carboxypeptidase regulatory-like domain-containing protein [Acidobacteria bacterium]|nr:carboxypeptidase regulatory-like domain-containing protein [Acidobacteriota bacterium]